MLKLYCLCIGNQVVSGPCALPKYDRNGEHTYLDTLTEEELKKVGWLPWIPGNQRIFNKSKFKLIPYRYCTENYATEDYEAVPWTEKEYLDMYANKLRIEL